MFISIKLATFSAASDARRSEIILLTRRKSCSRSAELHGIVLRTSEDFVGRLDFSIYRLDNAYDLTPTVR